MTTEAELVELLKPLAAPEDDLAVRRLQLAREKIVSRMMEVSRASRKRFGARAPLAAGLALAAGFALASWGGVKLSPRRAVPAGIEVVALRGSVTGVHAAQSSALGAGAKALLDAAGTLETSENGGARIESDGVEIELSENTKVSLGELHAASGSSTLRLDRGQVRCVVPHRRGRTFAVVTTSARVVDVGTIFSVGLVQTATGVETVVHVEDGEVRIESLGGQSRVAATQSWVSGTEAREPAAPTAPAEGLRDDGPATQSPRRELVKNRPNTLAAEANLLRSGLASERKGELRAAVIAFDTLVKRYPDSQLTPDAKAALTRVKGRLESAP